MDDSVGDRVGQQLGNYRLVRLLGRGGFAEVYLGEHVLLNSQAALKVLRIHLYKQDREGFLVEAQNLARLTHPHIVRVFDFAVEGSPPFLVMEYAPNGTLRHRHPRGTRLSLETIVLYIKQIASALQYAHNQRLIHRDIKPENMLLSAHDEVLLSDFGLALLSPQTASFSTKPIEQPAGTVFYMAPEQLQGSPGVESDQYALGVVVYEWLCGRLPFHGSMTEVVTQHFSVPPPSLRELVPDLTPAIEEVVFKALAKNPQQRFASVQDFATALEQASQPASFPPTAVQGSGLSSGSQTYQTPIKPEPIWRIPTTFTPLIGREREVAAISELLQDSEVRLLTLLGIGGIGKTRLSIQVATDLQKYFTDGVCFVSLAEISNPGLVVPAIAQELGIREIGELPIFENVKVSLGNRQVLLLLDNFEQVLAAAPYIEELLAACPNLKVMVTSRAVLHLQAEHEFPVPPLDLPDLTQLPEHKSLTQNAAVALFLQRVRTILPSFQLTLANAHAIAEICVRLDGLPLAIELAAARIKLLPPQALLARLSQRLQVLTGGARTMPPRQQTLRNTLHWSYDLLDTGEQELFRRISVFVGGCTLEAVEAVCYYDVDTNRNVVTRQPTIDGVASLLDKSLLLQIEREGDEPRLLMLETVREYGLECLREHGEIEIIQRTHAGYYLSLVEEAEPHLKGVQQSVWLTRLEREQENMRTALGWLIEHEETELALRFCAALGRFWYLRGYWSEGRRWLKAALGLSQREGPTVARARALNNAGNLAYYQDDYAVARDLLEESVEICRTLNATRELINALTALGILMQVQDEAEQGHLLLEEAETLCRSLDSKWELSYLLRRLSQLVTDYGDLPRAALLAQEALALAQELNDKSLIATTFGTLAYIAARQGNLSQFVAYIQESLSLARELGDKYLIAVALQNLGYYTAVQGDLSQVASAQEGLRLMRELGDKLFISRALHSMGYVMARQGKLKRATAWYQEGLALAQEIGSEAQVGWHLIGLAMVAAAEGQSRRATRLFGAAEKRLDVNVDMNVVERAEYERTVQSVRAQPGEKTFETEWAQGSTMTPQQILAAPEEEARQDPQGAGNLPLAPTYPDGLTAREVEVLRVLAQGLTDAQIAEQLVISPRTVSTHITSIYRKIQVTSRSAATRYAMEHRLV